MIARWRILGVTTAIVLLSISACGTNKSSAKSTAATTSPSTSPSAEPDPAFQAKAALVCKTDADALRSQGPFPFPNFDPEHPDTSDFPRIADYEAKTAAAVGSWQTQLHALGQPSRGVTAWNTFLDAVDRGVKSTIEQQDAARRGDSATFTQTFHDLVSHGTAATQDALNIGLPSCDPQKLGA
jgi:hypothetical protein